LVIGIVGVIAAIFGILSFWPGFEGLEYTKKGFNLSLWAAREDYRQACKDWLVSSSLV
jgi:hypothetical protein